jgi:hypothetical protein
MAKFKILKTGETDIESTDIWRFCIHSDYPTQKVYAAGQTTLTVSSGSNSGIKTISHSLGYAPIVMAMFEIDGGKFVKVFGNVKVSRAIQAMQFFAVVLDSDHIAAANGFGPGASAVDSYVSINDAIKFRSSPGNAGVLPSPLQPNTNYYVVEILDSTLFKVSTTQGGSPVNITDGGGSYTDIFENVTDPYLTDLSAIYSVRVTSSSVSFICDPSIVAPIVEDDVDITVYYIILYDQI